jgi:hypothetical protein
MGWVNQEGGATGLVEGAVQFQGIVGESAIGEDTAIKNPLRL